MGRNVPGAILAPGGRKESKALARDLGAWHVATKAKAIRAKALN